MPRALKQRNEKSHNSLCDITMYVAAVYSMTTNIAIVRTFQQQIVLDRSNIFVIITNY